MPAKIYYDQDADLALLKDKTIAILGYGSQGHAHAQNLRDSGCNVLVAELPGTANYEQAVKDGFKPLATEEATKQGDIVTILLPDEIQADVFRSQIRQHLSAGNLLVCSHGFNVHFGQFDIPKRVATILVAPRGQATWCGRSICAGRACPVCSAWARGPAMRHASWDWPMPRESAAPGRA